MNTYLEDLVRDAQERQAARAVSPERILAKLPVRATRRRPVHRRGILLAAAACAVGLVMVAVPVATHLRPTGPEAGAGGLRGSGQMPDLTAPKPPSEVWPDAVQELPALLSTFRYTVAAVLNDGRYVVKPEAQYHRFGSPDIFDPRTGRSLALGGPPDRDEGIEVAEVFVVGDAVVWGLRWPGERYELWKSIPGDHASTAKVVSLPADGTVLPIGADSEAVYWRVTGAQSKPGVYRMPLATGRLLPVPGTEGYHDIAAFPWVRSERDLFNVVTGEHRPWVAPVGTTISCDPILCVGFDGGQVAVQRPDGSGFRRANQGAVPNTYSALDGRFSMGVFSDRDGRTWIWDRKTGAVAFVARLRQLDDWLMTDPLVQWEDTAGRQYVLNLAAIS